MLFNLAFNNHTSVQELWIMAQDNQSTHGSEKGLFR